MAQDVVTASAGDLRRHTPRLDIQGLRALAVIAVVAFHAGLPLPGGFVGVDIFFVISGYVITGMLMREWAQQGTIRMRNFYERRIKRLLPALFLVVLVTLLLSFLFGSPFDGQQRTTALTAIGAMTMTANAVIFLQSGEYFAVPPTNNPLLNTWSLSVEEQFYLVFPILFLGLLTLRSRVPVLAQRLHVLALGIGILALGSLSLSLLMGYDRISFRFTDPDWFAFYASPTRAWEFAAGTLAYLVTKKASTSIPHSLQTLVFWTGMLGIFCSLFIINEYLVFPGWIALLPVLATSAVLVTGDQRIPGKSILTNKAMVSLGDVSYSWYLWHWPLIAFAVLLFPAVSFAPGIAAVLSLLFAFLTFRYIENPLRFAPTFAGKRIIIFTLGSVGLVVLISGALIMGAQNSWGNPDIKKMSSQVSAKHLWQVAGCNTGVPVGERGPECTWNAEGSGEPVYLLGDSLAGALSEGVLKAAISEGRPVVVGTLGACPFITTKMLIEGRSNVECNEFVHDSITWISEQPPSSVIMSSSLGYTVLDFVSFLNSKTGEIVADKAGKERLYLAGLADALRILAAAGHSVSLVLPPPGFPQTITDANAWYPSQCSTIAALRNIEGCGESRTFEEAKNETERIFRFVTQVSEVNGARVLNPQSAVCVASRCSTNIGNNWLYIDGSHISVEMSERLAPTLIPFLR